MGLPSLSPGFFVIKIPRLHGVWERIQEDTACKALGTGTQLVLDERWWSLSSALSQEAVVLAVALVAGGNGVVFLLEPLLAFVSLPTSEARDPHMATPKSCPHRLFRDHRARTPASLPYRLIHPTKSHLCYRPVYLASAVPSECNSLPTSAYLAGPYSRLKTVMRHQHQEAFPGFSGKIPESKHSTFVRLPH